MGTRTCAGVGTASLLGACGVVLLVEGAAGGRGSAEGAGGTTTGAGVAGVTMIFSPAGFGSAGTGVEGAGFGSALGGGGTGVGSIGVGIKGGGEYGITDTNSGFFARRVMV
jgi:hypothetical protein